MVRSKAVLSSIFLGLSATLATGPAFAQPVLPAAQAAAQGLSYADLVDLSAASGLVIKATIRRMTEVPRQRAPDLAPGLGRFYIEADTQALLAGKTAIGESVNYLVDLPLDARGRAPKLKKAQVLLFALPVPGRPADIQLLSSAAQLPWSEVREQQVRQILADLAAPDAPAEVTGVRELLYVPGDLAGQGETQVFLTTKSGTAASITVHHEPGAAPVWGVSFSELVAELGHPPQRDTLGWYRLACFLPNVLPPALNVSESYASVRQADADYRMVLGELGVCTRTLPTIP
ncbi:hypothetical protein [Novosphingobium colocasiae]|uniref:Uncharacterized protein n=1 Tax=Novosphingobium colocasiae TaxID=1256513 RepID=A0A918PCM6_9SPHN|nr:hypothetical protein [Novosphingobium colocasiae]GGY99866.1 hypothetical protein GCM10011614_13580 [Novosphingobium colocasiae]